MPAILEAGQASFRDDFAQLRRDRQRLPVATGFRVRDGVVVAAALAR